MESAKYIGRVGILAVALGIGVALTTGTGLASADDSASSSSSSDSSSNSGSDSSSTSSSDTSDSSDSSSTTSETSTSDDRETSDNLERSEAESNADPAETAPERTQGRLERLQSEFIDRRAALRAKAEDVLSEARENLADATAATDTVRRQFADRRTRLGAPEAAATPEIPAQRRSHASRSDTVAAAGTDADARPQLSRPDRTEDADTRPEDDGATEAQRVLAPVTALRDAVVANPTLSLSPASSQPTASFEAPDAAEVTGTSFVTELLVTVGLAPLVDGSGPTAPGPSAALWALGAWARREANRDVSSQEAALKSADNAVSLAETTGEPKLMAAATGELEPLVAAAPGTVVIGPGQTAAPVINGSTTSTQTGWTTGNGSGVGVTDKWYIGGTDLGIMWDSGITADGKPVIFTLFGDTYDVADPASNLGWRDNVLLRASDLNLNNGLQFSEALIHAGANANNPGVPTWWRPTPQLNRAGAAQVIDPSAIDALRRTNTYTLIPTAAIAGNPIADSEGNPVLDDEGNPLVTQYATVMSIKQWGQPGSWTTNWSAIAVSEDNGKTWTIDPDTVRSASGGNANFQQNALVYGDSEDATSFVDGDLEGERYVYVYGTPAGRQGSAYVARVSESQITDLSAYEYFAGGNSDGTGKWVVGAPSDAVAVISSAGAAGTIFPETGILGIIFKPLVSFLKFIYPAGFRPGGIFYAGGSAGNVSEMSVQYNEELDKYVALYTDGGNKVVMRVSDSPQGTWSDATVLQANDGYGQNTGMYAPMIHPLSGTGQLQDDNDGSYLYYNLSQWNEYNVRMMRADLSSLTIT